ncbi:hypothetical protein BC830DRAFT_1085633 [Chytriomyces sp. MP71]|nr:hypothetical protein BC830DRAFT_1085633 [Chytriomyces sp. MP71]
MVTFGLLLALPVLVLSQQLNLTYTGKQYYSQPGCTGTVTTVIWSETPGGCSKDSSCATNGYTVTCVTDTLNTLINYATHMMGSDGEIAQIKFWNDGTSKCAHFDSSKMYHHKVGACVAARDEDPSKDGSLSFRIQHASDALTMTNDRFSDSECMSPLFQDKITYDLTQRDCTEAIWGQFDSVDIFPVPTEGALASAVARKLLPSSAASASNYTSSQPSSTNSTPIIVGVVVGLIAIVAAIALGIYLHRRNQAHSASKQAPAAYAPVVPSPNAAAPSPPPSTFLPSEATPVFIQMPPQELARPAAYQAAPLPEKAPAALFYAQMNAPDPSIASSSSSTASLFDALQPPPAGAAAPPRREAEPLPVKNMAVYLAENTTSEDAAAKPASGVQVREEKKEKQALFNGLELPMTPSDWTVEQVKEWMTSMTDEEVAGKVVENDINGDTLFHLSSEDLESMGIKVIGQRVRLLKAIKELKAVEEVTSASATVYTEDLPPSYNFMSA